MQSLAVTFVKVADVAEAPWNVNVMGAAERLSLRTAMKSQGPEKTDPIHTCIIAGQRITIDGAQKLSVAKELGWTQIAQVDHPEVQDEGAARVFNYQRDFARGTIDPYRLGKTFRWFAEMKGLTQKQIGDAFGLSQEKVSRTMQLDNIDPEVAKQIRTDTQFGGGSVSLVEPIAALPRPLQRQALTRVKQVNWYNRNQPLTVRQVEEAAREVKADDDEKKKLQAAIDASEFKKCPKCGGPAIARHVQGLPYVTCSHFDGLRGDHAWSLKTGKTVAEIAAAAREQTPEAHRTQGPDQFVRTTHEAGEFMEAFGTFAQLVVKGLVSIQDLRISGIGGDGKRVHLDIDRTSGIGIVTLSYSGGGEEVAGQERTKVYLRIEPKKYDVPSLKDFKASITSGSLRGEKDQAALLELATGLLKQYGSKGGRSK